MHAGYLAAIATLACWTNSVFALSKLARLVSPQVLNRAVLFFGIFLLGILVCILDNVSPRHLFTLPTASHWLWLGLSGIIGKSIGDYLGYCGYRILGARRRSMLNTLTPGFVLLFGILLLGEKVNWLGVIAMTITIFSLLMLVSSTAEKEEILNEKFGLPLNGFIYGIAASALTALAFLLSKKALIGPGQPISEFHATWIRILIAFAASIAYDVISGKRTFFLKEFTWSRQTVILLFYIVFFGAVLGLSFSLIAVKRLNTTVAFTIFSLVPMVVLFIRVLFYREKLTLQSWIYSLLAVSGTLILIWRDDMSKWF